MEAPGVRVLDVGQCDLDHGNIRGLIEGTFSARVERAHDLDGAMRALSNGRYALVLVNRLLDRDGSEGLELVRRIKADPTLRDTAIMLVSNHPDAQAAAVEMGTVPGFGKAALAAPETKACLASILQPA